MGRLFLNFGTKLSELRRSVGGSVGVIFALSVVPMMGLAGVAIDYAAVSKSRTSLQGVADAAALYAVSDQVVKPNVVWSDQKNVTLAAAKKEFEA